MNITKTEAQAIRETTNATKIQAPNKQQNGPFLSTTEKNKKNHKTFQRNKYQDRIPNKKTQYQT
jgi:hypothetical protein